jgi:hypothetical protein
LCGFHRFGIVQIDTLKRSNTSLPFDEERLLLRQLFRLETLENLAALAKEPQHCLPEGSLSPDQLHHLAQTDQLPGSEQFN